MLLERRYGLADSGGIQMVTEEEYVASGMALVPGWFDQFDAWMFSTVTRLQSEAGLGGDLLEIGVYAGRSAILLGYRALEGERVLVCDLFGQEAPDAVNRNEMAGVYGDYRVDHSLSRQAFEERWRECHETPPEIVHGPSSLLADQFGDRRFRFAHVDGSHIYEIVAGDIEYCQNTVMPGGIVVFDDYRSLHTPGVSRAVWESVLGSGLVPIAATAKKLYATWSGSDNPVTPAALTAAQPPLEGHELVVSDLAGQPVVIVLREGYLSDDDDDVVEASWRRAARAVTPPIVVRGARELRDRFDRSR